MHRDRTFSLLIGALILLAMPLSLLAGPVPLSAAHMLDWLAGAGTPLADTIFSGIRGPRVVLALMCGFVLGLAGAAVQGLLRNPLAEPGLLGASNAAALGSVVVIYLGLSGTLSLAVPAAAMTMALVSVVLLLSFAGQGVSSLRLILAGFAVSALAGAGISLALNLSPNAFAALEIAFWLLGAVENRNWAHVWLALPGALAGCALMLSTGRALDGVALGEDVAASLGVSVARLRLHVALGMALAVGSVVAVTGVIGFIGLLAPHMARPFCGHLPSRALLASGLLGGLILVLADTLIRLLPTTTELKLGVVTAFLGVPLLLYLLGNKTLVSEQA